MMQSIITFYEELRNHFRIADAFDIVIMSVIIYCTLRWFRETASRRVLIGLIVVLLTYFLARTFDMYLVSLILQAGFAVLIIILVVIFQDDLRRLFERIAAVRWPGRLHRQPRDLPIDVSSLVESVFAMAASRTGALIVLKGSEPLDRHIEGGTPLDGKPSQQLLYSIFDASSPGHDGAVVIDNDRIERFAAHLPVSKNHQAIGLRGTRHAAALGLAEYCDALIIVVSEEHGSVSIAEAGKLVTVESPSVMKGRIDSFYESRFPNTRPKSVKPLIFSHGGLKTVALALAVAAWFTIAYKPNPIQRTFVVPIEYRGVNPGLLLEEAEQSEARVTLSGTERSFRFLEPGTLRITLDLSTFRAGSHEVVITEREVRPPQNITLYRVVPRIVKLDLRRE